MAYRIDKTGLLERIGVWDNFLKRKVRLIACGGTALTLLDIKPSTKDIDLIVPDLGEYEYLVDILKQLGYKPASGWGWARDDGFIFDLFRGKPVDTDRHRFELDLADPLLNIYGHIVDCDAEPVFIFDGVFTGHCLGGKAHIHNACRVSLGGSKINQSAFSEQVNTLIFA
jgi:hypothetical protein